MSTVLTHRVALAIGCVALLALTSVCTGTDSIPPFKPGFAVSPAGGTATGLFDETTTRDFGRKMLTGGEPSARKKKELRRVEKVEKVTFGSADLASWQQFNLARPIANHVMMESSNANCARALGQKHVCLSDGLHPPCNRSDESNCDLAASASSVQR